MSNERKNATIEMLRNRGYSEAEIAEYLAPAIDMPDTDCTRIGGGLIKESAQ